MEGRRRFKLPVIADEVTSHFMGDANFLRRFARSYLRKAVYELGVFLIGERRRGDRVVSTATLQDVAPSVWGRWEHQMEHAGDIYISLLDLTRQTGQVVVAERRARAESEERVATFIERLIAPLTGNQKIRNHWKPLQVDKMAEELQQMDDAA